MDLLAVPAPISGIVAESLVVPGSRVSQGDLLARIVDVEQVDVVGSIHESEAGRLRDLRGAEMVVPGVELPIRLERLVSSGRTVDPDSRMLQVRYALDNGDLALSVGQAVTLSLAIGEAAERVSVPESAVVEDGGRPVVFVQSGGESFERRPVALGNRESGWVHVLEGIESGERVVSTGAWLVRLSALSTQIPAHGHVH